jgi:methionyl-tRNA formyltransferase
LKIIFLSTETTHHNYFINRISKEFDVSHVLFERRGGNHHVLFEGEQERFELKYFGRDLCVDVDDKKVISVHSVNNKHLSKMIKSISPDIAISFGTGLIKPYIYNIPKFGTINVHRGKIEKYKGLDSDWWAVYNNDFYNIGSCIHCVDKELDVGKIIKQGYVDPNEINNIYELQGRTTKLACDMTIDILSELVCGNKLCGHEQTEYGKYYSSMPTGKKFEANYNLQRFKRYGK